MTCEHGHNSKLRIVEEETYNPDCVARMIYHIDPLTHQSSLYTSIASWCVIDVELCSVNYCDQMRVNEHVLNRFTHPTNGLVIEEILQVSHSPDLQFLKCWEKIQRIREAALNASSVSEQNIVWQLTVQDLDGGVQFILKDVEET